jgi:hypothetical protein
MSYIIRKTDGTIVATVTDGTVDKVSTSITLIGKNYKGIGEIYNTNLVALLENFSNSSPPNNQIKGQLWFNSGSSKLNVFDGENWRPVGSPFVATSIPANLVKGDLWIDSLNQQLKFFDGINLTTAGPMYTAAQGKSGWIVEDILDETANGRVIAGLYVNNVRMGILSATTFIPQQAITGFTTVATPEIKAGLTFNSSIANNRINAPVNYANNLVDAANSTIYLDSTKFVRTDRSNSTSGSLSITSNQGLVVGAFQNFKIYVDPTATVVAKVILSNEIANSKTIIQSHSTTDYQNAIVIDPVTRSVSIYPEDTWVSTSTSAPTFNLNTNLFVQGNTTIQGNLEVVGTTKFTNSTTLQITDKNIEIAVTNTPSNTTANGAGITVLAGAGVNKTIVWNLGTSPTPNAWDISDNVRVPSNKSFYIGTNNVITSSTLGPSVLASSLTSVGALTNLVAAKFSFTDNVLLVTNDDLEIRVQSDKILRLTNAVRFANVADPQYGQDVATKNYVDNKKTSLNYLTLDITGIASPDTGIVGAINAMIPTNSVKEGDEVRVMCLSYTNGASVPTVARVVKRFQIQLVSQVKTWTFLQNISV